MGDKLIVALVAASSAVGGVLLAQAFTLIKELIISKRENNSLLRAKCELLSDKLSESNSRKINLTTFATKVYFQIL